MWSLFHPKDPFYGRVEKIDTYPIIEGKYEVLEDFLILEFLEFPQPSLNQIDYENTKKILKRFVISRWSGSFVDLNNNSNLQLNSDEKDSNNENEVFCYLSDQKRFFELR